MAGRDKNNMMKMKSDSPTLRLSLQELICDMFVTDEEKCPLKWQQGRNYVYCSLKCYMPTSQNWTKMKQHYKAHRENLKQVKYVIMWEKTTVTCK